MLTYTIEYCVIFVLLLVTAYVVPAGLFHYFFFTRCSTATEAMRIQKRRPSSQDIRREIRQSVSALLLFSAYCLVVYHAARNGATALYFEFAQRPWWWAAAGVRRVSGSARHLFLYHAPVDAPPSAVQNRPRRTPQIAYTDALVNFVVPATGNHFSVRLLCPGDFLRVFTSGDVARLSAVRRPRQRRRTLRPRIRRASLTATSAAEIPQRGDPPRPAPHSFSLQFRAIFQHFGPPLRYLLGSPGCMISIIIPTLNEAKIIES